MRIRYVTNVGPGKTSANYPGFNKFSDESGSGAKGNLNYYIEPDDTAYAQVDRFCPNEAEGFTQAGLSRINRLIEAFVYCVLGSRSNQHSGLRRARKRGAK